MATELETTGCGCGCGPSMEAPTQTPEQERATLQEQKRLIEERLRQLQES